MILAIEAFGLPADVVSADESLAAAWYLVPVGICGTGAYLVLSVWATREQQFGVLARTRISQALGQAGAELGFGAVGAGQLGLVAGALAGQVTGNGTLVRAFGARGGLRLQSGKLARWRVAAKASRHFALYSTPSSLMTNLGMQLPAIILLVHFGVAEAGYFALMQRVVGAPVLMLATIVAQVYTGAASRHIRESPEQLESLFVRLGTTLAASAAVPALLAAALGPSAFVLIFGSDWEPAGDFVRVLALMFFVQTVSLPLAQTLNLLQRVRAATGVRRGAPLAGGRSDAPRRDPGLVAARHGGRVRMWDDDRVRPQHRGELARHPPCRGGTRQTTARTPVLSG